MSNMVICVIISLTLDIACKCFNQIISTKTECDYLYGWIKNESSHTQKKISPKMMKPRDVAGNAEEEEKPNFVMTDRLTSSIHPHDFIYSQYP